MSTDSLSFKDYSLSPTDLIPDDFDDADADVRGRNTAAVPPR